jgi:putative aminopeptidase FrvX
MDASEHFLRDYLNSCAAPGRKDSCRDLWIKYIEPFSDRIVRDSYDSVAAIQGDGQHTVTLEAHSDEIAWLVNYISAQGYIYVVKSGGSDPVIAPSKKVKIFSRKGIVAGVFAWPSQSNRDTTDNAPTTANLFIDVGCSTKEEVVDLGIEVGDPVLFDDSMIVLNDRFYSGRALDNRIGGFIIAEVARRIRTAGHDFLFAMAFVNAAQEEVGLRGAEMMAHRLRPSLALVVDVVNDTNTPRVLKHEKGDIAVGRGPVLSTAPSVHPLLLEKLIAVARDRGIAFQRTAMPRSTGTDADAFAYSRAGIVTGLICVPVKYMHTTVETVHKNDVAATIELLYHFLLSLNFDELEADGLFGSSYSVGPAKRQSPDRSAPTEALSLERDGHAR